MKKYSVKINISRIAEFSNELFVITFFLIILDLTGLKLPHSVGKTYTILFLAGVLLRVFLLIIDRNTYKALCRNLSNFFSLGGAILLPLLLGLLLAVSTAELFHYPGLVQEHLNLKFDPIRWMSAMLLILTPSAIILLLKSRLRKKLLTIFIPKIFYLLLFLTAMAWTGRYLFLYLDTIYYDNYSFATFHIHPVGFTNLSMSLASLSAFVFIFMMLKNRKELYNSSPKVSDLLMGFQGVYQTLSLSIIQALTLVSMFGALILYSQYATQKIALSYANLHNISKSTQSEATSYLLGGRQSYGWIAEYTDFIKTVTPDNAVIFIPPQIEHWTWTGNKFFMLYFLYPRKMVVATDLYQGIPESVTHVLISHGLLKDVDEDAASFGWPKIIISSAQISRIDLIDRSNLEKNTILGEAYYQDPSTERWGIITLR